MTLPREYTNQVCSAARALEIVGERWTLLIVRDAFYGVRRFSDFVVRLQIPRAVLTDRLGSLVAADILDRVPGPSGRDEYELTGKGVALWPVIRSLITWGDEYYGRPEGPRRLFLHAADEAPLDGDGVCTKCHQPVEVADILLAPGAPLDPQGAVQDPVSTALDTPHRLLQPVPAPGAQTLA